MHKDRAVKRWMCRLSISRMEANEKWDVERAKARFVKHDGPNGEDGIPVKEDDFLLAEDGILEEKVMSKEHKRSKHNEDVCNLLEEGLQGRAGLDMLDSYGLGNFDHPDLVCQFLGSAKSSASVEPAGPGGCRGAALQEVPEGL